MQGNALSTHCGGRPIVLSTARPRPHMSALHSRAITSGSRNSSAAQSRSDSVRSRLYKPSFRISRLPNRDGASVKKSSVDPRYLFSDDTSVFRRPISPAQKRYTRFGKRLEIAGRERSARRHPYSETMPSNHRGLHKRCCVAARSGSVAQANIEDRAKELCVCGGGRSVIALERLLLKFSFAQELVQLWTNFLENGGLPPDQQIGIKQPL
jgi:hypothetical protein